MFANGDLAAYDFSGRCEHEAPLFRAIPDGERLYLSKKPPDTIRIEKAFLADEQVPAHDLAQPRDHGALGQGGKIADGLHAEALQRRIVEPLRSACDSQESLAPQRIQAHVYSPHSGVEDGVELARDELAVGGDGDVLER